MNFNKLSEQLLEWIKECENSAEEYIQEIGDSSEGDRKLAEAAAYRNVYDYLTKVKIPITPEVLERCGFEKFAESSIHRTVGYKIGSLTPFQIEESILYFYSNGRKVKINYLHELQNLVFALTGQELKISEK